MSRRPPPLTTEVQLAEALTRGGKDSEGTGALERFHETTGLEGGDQGGEGRGGAGDLHNVSDLRTGHGHRGESKDDGADDLHDE